MHSAPAVSFPVGRSRFQGSLVGVLIMCCVLTVTAWSLQADALGWRHWVAVSACWATSVWAVWHEWRTPKGNLAWDGGAWYWAVDAQSLTVVPEVVIDFQHLVLLRLRDPVGTFVTWVWVARAFNPLRWVALRRAIYTHTRRHNATDVLSLLDEAPRRAS